MSTLEEDDKIYIDCFPTDELGNVVDENENIKNNNNKSLSILDELIALISGGEIYANIGAQTILAIILFTILYAVGNFIFKQKIY